jgi:hypothetical protein
MLGRIRRPRRGAANAARGNPGRAVAAWAAAAALMALAVLSGMPGTIEIPYWYLSYSQGFIRRALVGSLTMPWPAGRPLGGALHIVSATAATAALWLFATADFAWPAGMPRLDPSWIETGPTASAAATAATAPVIAGPDRRGDR